MHVMLSLCATDAGKSGVSTYVRGLYRALLAGDGLRKLTLVGLPGEAEGSGIDLADPRVRSVVLPRALGGREVNVAWHLLGLPLLAHLHGADLVHLPVGNRRPGFGGRVPVVATIHDLGEREGDRDYGLARSLYVRHVIPRTLRLARRLVLISESTRAAVGRYMPELVARSTVVHNGVELGRFRPGDRAAARREVAEKLGVDGPYLLYPARLEHPAKNHLRLIAAFEQARRRAGLPHRLVLVGARWHGWEKVLNAVRLGGDAVQYAGFVARDLLPVLVRGADAVVFPSLMEGFGLPPLEAMASGTPVVAADAAALPEVVGDAGLLVDARSEDALAEAIVTIVRDDDLRERLVAKGLARAREFSWEACARRMSAVFGELARGRPENTEAGLPPAERTEGTVEEP